MNESYMRDLFKRTQPIKRGHYFFTPEWHSPYNVLLQICIKDVKVKSEIGRRMYGLVRDTDASVILAINGCIAFSLAQDIGARLGGKRETIHGHRHQGYFYVPHFFRISPGQKVLIVDDGIVTATGVCQAVEHLLRNGAECVGVVSAYSRYPEGKDSIAEKLRVPVQCLYDLHKVYPIIKSGAVTCDQCAELEDIEQEIFRRTNRARESSDLAMKKAILLPRGAYEEFWGYQYNGA